MKILLIEDSQMMQRHIQQLLAEIAYSIQLAATIAEATRAFERELPDLVLVDYILSNKETGLGAIELLKNIEKTKGVETRRWALLTHADVADADLARAKTLGVPIVVKPTRGKESDFLDSVRSLAVGIK